MKVKRSGDFDVLTPVEVAAVARAAGSAQDAALITVAAFTGLRLGELRALRWRDVDFAEATGARARQLHARAQGPPKSGKVRSVPLIDQAAGRSTGSRCGSTSRSPGISCSARTASPLDVG